jgi:hypothetical protein
VSPAQPAAAVLAGAYRRTHSASRCAVTQRSRSSRRYTTRRPRPARPREPGGRGELPCEPASNV